MAVISSFGWTGLGTNILKPADSARVRSSTRTMRDFAFKYGANQLWNLCVVNYRQLNALQIVT